MSVVVLLAVGFAHDALVVGITIGGSALAAAVLVPAGELAWNWLQAPMRLLTEDVIAIRARLNAVEIVGARPEPTIDVRLQLLNYKRKGEELVASSSVGPAEPDAQRWTDSVIDFLSKYMHESVASFIGAPWMIGGDSRSRFRPEQGFWSSERRVEVGCASAAGLWTARWAPCPAIVGTADACSSGQGWPRLRAGASG